ncbi:Rieske 2Fe-2S domain-containing protein [Streptomyces sp. NPDC020799]|uniref:Rieske 2Fe-2S domain-containing protein n=1 Tax=Streptomyces sp. NPDC020799 TaxID=3365091 RepID=UPI0037B834F4
MRQPVTRAPGTAELPYPNGWFAVAYQDRLRPGQVVRRRLMGENIVLYRTHKGTVRAIDPYCPHLGAHLGHGGRVEGEELVCPFHHFAFAPDGACVRTAYGKKVPSLTLRGHECRERNHVILVWWHAEGLPPQWEIPELWEDGFPSPIRRTSQLTAYPQDIHENAFDVGHFPTLHGYRSAQVVSSAFEGNRSESHLIAERYFPLVGAIDFPMNAQGFGLGLTHFLVRIPGLGAQGIAYFFTTPLEPQLLELRVLASSLIGAGASVPRGLRSLRAALSWMLTHALRPSMNKDLDANVPVWEHKTYVNPPRLAEGDGHIGPYRHWARQFYTWPQENRPPGPAS